MDPRKFYATGYSFLLLMFLSTTSLFSQTLVLSKRMYHLRLGSRAEWTGFDRGSPKPQLMIQFNGRANLTEHTLSLRHEDVKRIWRIELNGKVLGKLEQDENAMLAYLPVPPKTIITGKNTLLIRQLDTIPDDIRVGDLIIIDRPVQQLLSEATLNISVVEAKHDALIPARITIINAARTLQPVSPVPGQQLAVRSGCVYSGDGKASFTLPAGKYTVFASRGFEYAVDSFSVVLKRGEKIQRKLAIAREVPTDGWISCDTHIHTFTYSGHGDATTAERVLTIAGEGIELPVMTDHNIKVDIDSLSTAMNVRNYYTPVAGDEFTSPVGHFNIFPMDMDLMVPDHRVRDWKGVSANLGGMNNGKAIILNHARDIHTNFRPFDPKRHIAAAGIELDEWTFPANAMEVVNSGSQQKDIMRLYHDWFGMMNRGHFLTPVGSSDSHDVNRFLVGQGRTYIKYNGDDPSRIDVRKATDLFLEGKVMVSFGLLAEIKVDNVFGPGDIVPASGQVKVSVRVLAPSWLKARRVSLYANGLKIREQTVKVTGRNGIKWSGSWLIPLSKQDMFLVAIAEGPGTSTPFWAIPKPYQPTSPDWDPKIIGSSGAVWIDADGDGIRTSAYAYATKVAAAHDGDILKMAGELASYDETVSIQAAAILYEKHALPSGPRLEELLRNAAPAVKRGFQVFVSAWEASGMPGKTK